MVRPVSEQLADRSAHARKADEAIAAGTVKKADRAEDLAGHAIAFALAAIDNPEESVLDAILAREAVESRQELNPARQASRERFASLRENGGNTSDIALH